MNTLTDFMTRSTKVMYAKSVKMSLMEKKSPRNVYDLEKMTPGVHLPPPWGYIQVYD